MKLKDIILALLSLGLIIFGIAFTHILPTFIYVSILYSIIITLYFLYNLISKKDKKQIICIIIALLPIFVFIY